MQLLNLETSPNTASPTTHLEMLYNENKAIWGIQRMYFPKTAGFV